mgnify:CR=1 FL=1
MKRIIVLIGMVFVFLACTGDFKEINTDKSGVTDENLQADYNEHGIRLGIIQQGIYSITTTERGRTGLFS